MSKFLGIQIAPSLNWGWTESGTWGWAETFWVGPVGFVWRRP